MLIFCAFLLYFIQRSDQDFELVPEQNLYSCCLGGFGNGAPLVWFAFVVDSGVFFVKLKTACQAKGFRITGTA